MPDVNTKTDIETIETASRSRTLKRVFRMVGVAALLGVCLAVSAFAAGGTIEEGVTQGATSIYKILISIVAPIAAVCFAFCGFKLLFGNEKDVQSAKKTMLIIVAAIAIVLLAPIVIKQVAAWFSGNSANLADIQVSVT